MNLSNTALNHAISHAWLEAGICPSNETLDACAAGTLPPVLAGAVDEHLAQCPECADLVERLKAAHELISAVEQQSPPAALSPAKPRRIIWYDPSRRPLSFPVGGYRSTHASPRAAAGPDETDQNYSNPEGFLLDSPQGDLRFYVNLREGRGRTMATLALALPPGMASATVAWRRESSCGTIEMSLLTFTPSAPRVRQAMETPPDSEVWFFAWTSTVKEEQA